MNDKDFKKKFKDAQASYVVGGRCASVIQNLSRIIDQCQKNGMDVKLKTIGRAHGEGFSYISSGSVDLTGIIQIFDNEFMFVHKVKDNEEACSQLYLAKLDTRFKTAGENRAYSYDIDEYGQKAYDALTERIIDIYVTLEAYYKNDVCNVLEYQPTAPLESKKTGRSLYPTGRP